MSLQSQNEDNGRALGRLEGQMAHVDKSLARILQELSDLKAEMKPIVRDVQEMKPVVKELEEQMGRAIPVIEDVKKWRTMGAGVILALVLIGSLFSDILFQAKTKLVSFFFGG